MATPTQPTEPKAGQPNNPTGAVALTPLAKTLPGENGLRRLPDVVLFSAGRHTDQAGRTRDYPLSYVEAVAKNFTALKTDPDFHHEPPAVLGHETVQAKLAEILSGDGTYQKLFADRKSTSGGGPGRTDELAAGWPSNVRMEGDRLIGDLERIPPSVADLIDAGQIRHPSVELKDSATRPDGTPVGPFLWRLALLGGTPPGCKTIPALGQSHFADAPDGVVYFADAMPPAPSPDESTPTDGPPDKPMLALIQTCYKNLTTPFLESLNRKQLDQLAADHVAAQGQTTGSGDSAATQSHDQLVQAYVSANLGSQAVAQQMTDDQLRQALSAAGVTAMADSIPNPVAASGTGAAKPSAIPAELVAFADSLRSEFAEREKSLDAKAKAIKDAADASLATSRAREEVEWAKAVDAFCDAELSSGRISPAELDAKDPFNLRVRLKAIPATEVFSFADAAGAEITKSRREVELDAIRKKPIRRFGDHIPTNGAAADGAITPERKKELLASYGSLGRVALNDMQTAAARN